MCYAVPGPKCAKSLLEIIKRKEPNYNIHTAEVKDKYLQRKLDATPGGQQILMLAMNNANEEEKRILNRRLEEGLEKWAQDKLNFDEAFYSRWKNTYMGYIEERQRKNEEALQSPDPLTKACEENEALYSF